MATDERTECSLKPKHVDYDPITGVPSEFNEYLPKDSDEYKKWKAAQSGELNTKLAEVKLDKDGKEIEKQLPGGKKKVKTKPEIVLERAVRNKKKAITTITGLDLFGVKLPEASKLFGKKFASGAAITKSPEDKNQIDVQGDFLDKAAELIVKTWGQDKGISKQDIYFIDNKRKVAYFDEGAD
jgi:density-regulated protein DRP1